jgi:hypothetical protein
MNLLNKFFAFGFAGFVGLLLSLFVTLIAWNIQIESLGFHCTDDVGFATFFVDMDTHKEAGDTLSPGWTWDELEIARTVYMVAFFFIWFVSASLLARITLSVTKNRGHEMPPRPQHR